MEKQAKFDLVIDDKRIKHDGSVVQDSSPNAVIMMAMQKNYTPEFIEKMMELQERFEKNEARKAYVKAMAEFKKDPPTILKTKHVSYTNSKNQKVEWDHAVLGEIAEAIIKGLSENEFYHRWDMSQPDGNTVLTTCIITHSLGHEERVSMSGPLDRSGGKDDLKAVSSTNTLLQRLTLLAVTGLAAKGMDNECTPGSSDTTKYDEWVEAFNRATTDKIPGLTKFWKDHGETIKKECGAAQASKIYKMLTDAKKEMAAQEKSFEPEREPGQEG